MARKYSIAIDLGGTNLKIAIIDARLSIVNKRVLYTRAYRGKVELIAAMEESIKAILEDSVIKPGLISGIGVGLPGPVDAKKGLVHFLPNIPGWKKVALQAILSQKMHLPVYIDNDVKLMALAEYCLGAARGARCAVCLTLGTGVGGAIVMEGQNFRGTSNVSGEIGHLPINEEGPRCNCGGRGCLEAYIGNSRIMAQAKQVFRRTISLEELSALAKKGDRRAIAIWLEVGRHLGMALVAVVNLLNPDRIVIGGGVAKAGDLLFRQVAKVVRERSMPVQARDVKIVKARLGPDAGMIGAAIMVKRAS